MSALQKRRELSDQERKIETKVPLNPVLQRLKVVSSEKEGDKERVHIPKNHKDKHIN